MTGSLRLGILLFDHVEVLDFCGPLEVFSIANRFVSPEPFEIYTVSERPAITTHNGLSVNTDFRLDTSPPPQLLLVPGGIGTRQEIQNPVIVSWIQAAAEHAELVVSVCTGALLLGRVGLLDGLEVTTHHTAYQRLRELVPSCVIRETRYVDSGPIVTSAGITAGIDMSLHVVARLQGSDVARATAKQMEYAWNCE